MSETPFLAPVSTSWDNSQIVPQRGIAPLILSSPRTHPVVTGLADNMRVPVNRTSYLPIWKRPLAFVRPLDGVRDFGYRLRGTLRMYLPPNSAILQGIRPNSGLVE